MSKEVERLGEFTAGTPKKASKIKREKKITANCKKVYVWSLSRRIVGSRYEL